MFLTKLANEVFNYVKRSMPTILSVTASAGVIGTAVVSSKMTKKIEEKKKEIFEEDAPVPEKAARVVKEIIPLYLPIAGIVAGTIGCTIMSDVLNMRIQRHLAEGTLLMSALLRRYRNNVRNEVGVEKEQELYSEAVESLPKNGDSLIEIFDPRCQFWFKTTPYHIEQAYAELNRMMQTREGEVRLSDFYRTLPEIKLNDIPERAKHFGWNYDMFLDTNMFWIDYDLKSVVSDKRTFYEITWWIGPINLEYDDDDLGPWEAANEQIIFD